MKQVKLTNEEIGSLCMALAHLIHAGIGNGDALTLLREDEQDAACRKILAHMAELADGGAPLAAIFREAGCFPAYVCTLLDVGERVGKTEETLISLARYYDDREQMNRRLRAAILYPSILLSVLLAVVVILLVWVLPVFNDVYAQLGSRLTGVAGGLLALGSTLRKSLPFLCAFLALAAVIARIRPFRKVLVKAWKNRMGDRGVFHAINNARFIQALTMALGSGMTAQEAVHMATTLSEGEASDFQNRCALCLARLDAGDSLSQALRATAFLSPADCRLLEAGSRSGRSEQVMADISGRLSIRSEEALERTVGKIEPSMVAVACILIGTVLLCVMLPLMHIMTAIG